MSGNGKVAPAQLGVTAPYAYMAPVIIVDVAKSIAALIPMSILLISIDHLE